MRKFETNGRMRFRNPWPFPAAGASLAFLLAGCHHPTASAPAPVPVTTVSSGDRLADQYKKLRTADYDVDGAIQEIDDAMEASKTMAPKAGGDAEKALQSVAQLLDGSGESLGDYETVADTLEDFKKDFAAQDDRRLRAIKIAIDALSKLGDAADILTDLGKNVPDQYKQDLNSISDNVGQAQSDLQQAVTQMGGQLPQDTATESVDPVQDGTKPSQP